MKRFVLLVVIGMLTAADASAITVDGVLDAEYGSALAIQDTPTGFGDNQNELNAAYAKLDASGDLSLMLTGNLQDGGNGLVLFIDSRAGGAVAETLSGGFGKIGSVGGARTDDWGNDTDGGVGVSEPAGGASILDPGFNPNYSIEINISGGTYYTNIIDMTIPNEPNDNRDIYLGSNLPGAAAVTQTYFRDNGATNSGTIEHAFDNSNTDGVFGFDFGTPPGALGTPLSATKGYEAKFSAAFLANDGQPIRILAFITNNNGGFLSNQFLGEAGVAGASNLGGSNAEPGGVPLFDAQVFAGNQFFTVPAAGVAGDYNGNGTVDAADYVLWRNGGPLQNDATPGVQPGDYDVWKANFGKPSGAGSGSALSSVVPEPGSILLALIASVAGCFLGRRR